MDFKLKLKMIVIHNNFTEFNNHKDQKDQET